MSEAPFTPCVQICVIHAETGLCAGCHRTRDEIAAWSRLTQDERRAIMDTLPARADAFKQRRGGRAGRQARSQSRG